MKVLRCLFGLIVAMMLVCAPTPCTAGSLPEIPLPSVPSELRDPQARADYIIEHFWEQADSLGAYTRQAVEQAFSNFISVFPIASADARVKAVGALMDKASASRDDYAMIAEIADIYLYTFDSPIESEDYYILFLREITASPVLSDDEKIRYAAQLEDALLNRPGNIAADFEFDTRDGRHTSLHKEIKSRTLLIFYDPDCSHCRQVLARLMAEPIDADVIAVYSGDDRSLWEMTADQLPDGWTVGYEDGTLQEDGVYVLRTLPTLYLIGPDKIVVEKDIKK